VTCRPGHAPRHPDFEPGNELSLKFGGYSARRIGQRAAEVTEELVTLYPHLHAAGFVYALSGAGMARTRLEILHAEVEERAAAGRLNTRIIEDTNAADNRDAARFAAIGGDPRSQAEQRQIDSSTDLNAALVAQIAPEWSRSVRGALEATYGDADKVEVFEAHFFALLRAPQTQEDDH
jgi:hypothetical protein